MYFVSISRRFGPAVLSTKEQVEQRDLYRKILEFEQETVRACRCLIMKRKGATIEFRPSLDIEPLPHWWEASALIGHFCSPVMCISIPIRRFQRFKFCFPVLFKGMAKAFT